MQTSYPLNPAPAFEGMPDHMGPKHDDTYRADGTIPFGRFVRDVGDGTVVLPSATGQTIAGASLHNHLEQDANGIAQYVKGDAVPVRKLGRMWVRTEQDVTPADPLYVRHTVGGEGTALGQVRKDADTDKADAYAKAKFLTSAKAGELVLVSINNY